MKKKFLTILLSVLLITATTVLADTNITSISSNEIPFEEIQNSKVLLNKVEEVTKLGNIDTSKTKIFYDDIGVPTLKEEVYTYEQKSILSNGVRSKSTAVIITPYSSASKTDWDVTSSVYGYVNITYYSGTTTYGKSGYRLASASGGWGIGDGQVRISGQKYTIASRDIHGGGINTYSTSTSTWSKTNPYSSYVVSTVPADIGIVATNSIVKIAHVSQPSKTWDLLVSVPIFNNQP